MGYGVLLAGGTTFGIPQSRKKTKRYAIRALGRNYLWDSTV